LPFAYLSLREQGPHTKPDVVRLEALQGMGVKTHAEEGEYVEGVVTALRTLPGYQRPQVSDNRGWRRH
jgi:hypothetical protein